VPPGHREPVIDKHYGIGREDAGDWRIVTLRDVCEVDRMAIAFWAEIMGSGQITRDPGLARAGLQRLPDWHEGLASSEELVHDLGAGGDDGA
jgi:hypothetical protein